MDYGIDIYTVLIFAYLLYLPVCLLFPAYLFIYLLPVQISVVSCLYCLYCFTALLPVLTCCSFLGCGIAPLSYYLLAYLSFSFVPWH